MQDFIFLTLIMWPHWIFFNLQRLYKRKTKKGDNSVTKQNFEKMIKMHLDIYLKNTMSKFQYPTPNRLGPSRDTYKHTYITAV